MCYLHSTLSTYPRGNATSGIKRNATAASANGAATLLVARTLLLLADTGNLFSGLWPSPAPAAPPYAFACNGYFSPGGVVHLTFPGNLTGAAWQAAGQDVGALIGVDPKVAAPEYVVPLDSHMVTQC